MKDDKTRDRELTSLLMRLAAMVEDAAIANASGISERHRKKADRLVEATRMMVKKTHRLREAVK